MRKPLAVQYNVIARRGAPAGLCADRLHAARFEQFLAAAPPALVYDSSMGRRIGVRKAERPAQLGGTSQDVSGHDVSSKIPHFIFAGGNRGHRCARLGRDSPGAPGVRAI